MIINLFALLLRCRSMIIFLPTIPKTSSMPNEASGLIALLARRGVKGRKSLVGDCKGATPPWILEERITLISSGSGGLAPSPPAKGHHLCKPTLRAVLFFFGASLQISLLWALVGAHGVDDHHPFCALAGMQIDDHLLANDPQNQLDAQRGVGPDSLACKAWGQGVETPCGAWGRAPHTRNLVDHPLPHQLDAQRGIEPCSEALAERGVFLGLDPLRGVGQSPTSIPETWLIIPVQTSSMPTEASGLIALLARFFRVKGSRPLAGRGAEPRIYTRNLADHPRPKHLHPAHHCGSLKGISPLCR